MDVKEEAIRIEKIVFGGKGLSRDLSKVTFVPFTMPGEKVLVRVTREKPDYYEAEPVEIIEPSSDRISPECRYFGVCGGCQLSHAPYETQLDWKVNTLRETLQRGHIDTPKIDVFRSPPFGYRHRLQLKYDPHTNRVGFFEMSTNRIVDIQECLCLTPGLNRLLTDLRHALLSAPAKYVSGIECYENDAGETAIYFNGPIPEILRKELEKKTRVAAGGKDALIYFHYRNHTFPMHPAFFLQVNPAMIPVMVQEVESHYPRFTEDTAVELFCGTGLFTIAVAAKFRKVVAFEENAAAIEFARNHHPETNVQWTAARVENLTLPAGASALVMDPPRNGLQRKTAEAIANYPFQKITYISCDATSMARDLRILQRNFKVARLSLLDLFPQTFHFETIALLETKSL